MMHGQKNIKLTCICVHSVHMVQH